MKLCERQRYTLIVRKSFSYELSQNGKVCQFSKPSTKPKVTKIYTVTIGKKLIYVGISNQSMASRLNYGLKANVKSGYTGYKWKKLYDQRLTLNIWFFKSRKEEYIRLTKKKIREIEAIEAEVVYLCRNKTKQWPEYQHEIHFHKSDAKQRKYAQSIYKDVLM